jgi:hypothetical protein
MPTGFVDPFFITLRIPRTSFILNGEQAQVLGSGYLVNKLTMRLLVGFREIVGEKAF